MSTELVRWRPDPLVELASTANRELALSRQGLLSALEHAILAGEALLRAKMQIPFGQWQRWIDANFNGSRTLANDCINFAEHKDLLAIANVTTYSAARICVRGLVLQTDLRKRDESLMKEAQRLRAGGMPVSGISRAIGVSEPTIWRWVSAKHRRAGNAQKARYARRRRAALAALRREERARVARELGGETARAYSLLRRALQAADRALDEMPDRPSHQALSRAVGALHIAEDEIGVAIRSAHGYNHAYHKSTA